MLKMRNVLWMYLALIVCASALPENETLPAELQGVAIGMTWREAITARPNADLLQWGPGRSSVSKPDPEEPGRALTEEFAHDVFNRVMYGFENGILTSVVIGGPIKTPVVTRGRFLERILRQCGEPENYRLQVGRTDDLLLSWSKGDVVTRALLPAAKDAKKGAVCLQVMRKSVEARFEQIRDRQDGSEEPATNHVQETLVLITNELRSVLASIQAEGAQQE